MKRAAWTSMLWTVAILGSTWTTRVIKEPPDCKINDCSFYLHWEVVNNSQINFDLSAMNTVQDPWVAFGLGEQPRMPDSSIVECLYENGVIKVQASYNTDHKNRVLNNTQLGIVKGSTSGRKTDSGLACRFSHVIRVDQKEPEAPLVKPLDVPHFVLMSTEKKKHQGVFISKTKVNFFNGAYVGFRSPYIMAHGSVMILVWFVLLNLTTLMSRYFKDDWIQGLVVYWRPVWFQAHRFCAFFSASLIVVSILVVSSYKDWTFFAGTHSILGLTVTSLIALNLISGMLRPGPDSSARIYFRFFHGLSGHLITVLGCVTMFFGLSHPSVVLPFWATWVPIGYLVFRLIVDIALTCLATHNTASRNFYVQLIEREELEDETWSWRYAIAVSHIVISFGASLVLVIALVTSPASLP